MNEIEPRRRPVNALFVLALIYVGLPAFALRQLGSPARWSVPSVGELSSFFRGETITDSAVLGALAAAALLVWMLALLSLISEGLVIVRHRERGSLRFLGPQHRWILGLLASAATVSSGISPAGATGRANLSTYLASVNPGAVMQRTLSDVNEFAPSSGSTIHTVEAGESLWLIAERYLGNGFEWERLAAFNDGRVEPGGAKFSAAAAHLNPGWTLEIPGLEAARGASTETVTVTVEPGDTLWGIAATHLGDGHRWPEIYERNRDVEQSDHAALVDPNLIMPGWTLQLGGGGSPGTILPTTEHEPALQPPLTTGLPIAPSPTSSTASPASAQLNEAAREGSAPNVAPNTDVTRWGILAASSALAMVVLRRRRRERHIVPGQTLHVPSDAAALRDQRLRSLAVPNLEGYLAATANLTEYVSVSGGVAAVRWDGSRLSVSSAGALRMNNSDDACGDWHWVTPSELGVVSTAAAAGGARRSAAVAPALVGVGSESAGFVALNIEALGAVEVRGAHERENAFLAGMLLELDGGGSAPAVEVIAVGDRIDELVRALDLRGRVRCVDNGADLRAYLTATRQSVAAALEPGVWRLESQVDSDVIRPVVVVFDGAEASCLDLLLDMDRERPPGCDSPGGFGVGLVFTTAEFRLEHTILELRDSATVLSQLGLVLDPLESSMVLELTRADSATPEQVLAIDIASASFPVQLPSGTTIGDSAPERSTATTADDLPEAGGATGLYVRLFGTPRVEGSTGELRERHVECIAFLALRGPTDSDRVKTALWPARMPSDSRWSSFLSELRGALGATAEGELVFPHLRSKGLRLNGSVDTDIDEFTRIYTQVRDGKGPAIERATTMLAALGLVAGQPFQSRRGYEWAFSDGTVACIERIIGEACHLTVDLALEARELEIASHAIERGLNALPGSELLYRDRMRVAHARGDRAEIDRAFKELADILEAEDMECAPHPETVALRDELMTSQLERI